MRIKHLAILGSLVTVGCAGGPVGPSAIPSRPPIVLSGQSNAVNVSPYLTAAYGNVAMAASSGQSIARWDWTDTGSSGQAWRDLAPLLSPSIHALVWWQGESDYNNPQYRADLGRLMAHIREVAHNPQLRIVIVQVENDPGLSSVRAAQADYVASDPYARMVSTDGAPLRPGELHLTETGYQMMTQRIIATLE